MICIPNESGTMPHLDAVHGMFGNTEHGRTRGPYPIHGVSEGRLTELTVADSGKSAISKRQLTELISADLENSIVFLMLGNKTIEMLLRNRQIAQLQL